MSRNIFIAIIGAFVVWKAWQRYNQPSQADLMALSSSLSQVLCRAEVFRHSDRYYADIGQQAREIASERSESPGLTGAMKTGVKMGHFLKERTAAVTPEIRRVADPIFERAGWSAQRIQRLLKKLDGNGRHIIDPALAKAKEECSDYKDDSARSKAATLILGVYFMSGTNT